METDDNIIVVACRGPDSVRINNDFNVKTKESHSLVSIKLNVILLFKSTYAIHYSFSIEIVEHFL
jgi:hypothetical protein